MGDVGDRGVSDLAISSISLRSCLEYRVSCVENLLVPSRNLLVRSCDGSVDTVGLPL